MLLTTTDVKVEYEVLGIVVGSKVKAVHLGKDIIAVFRKLIGGDVSEYSQLLNDVREAALAEMEEKAKKMGANAVVGIRFASSTISTGMAEIYAYGTAIKI